MERIEEHRLVRGWKESPCWLAKRWQGKCTAEGYARWQSFGPAPFQLLRVCNPFTRWSIACHVGRQPHKECVGDKEFQVIARSTEKRHRSLSNPLVLR